MTAVADRQPGPGRQVGRRQVEVDVELVAGQRHPLRPVGHERGGPGVHDVELHLGVGGAVRRALAAPLEPGVADEPDLEVELPLAQHLALAGPGAPYDEGRGCPRRLGEARRWSSDASSSAVPRWRRAVRRGAAGAVGVVLGIEVAHDADAASPAASATAVLRCGMLAGHARPPLGGSPVSDFEEYVAGRGPALVAFAVLLTGREDEARRLAQNALGRALARWDERRPRRGPRRPPAPRRRGRGRAPVRDALGRARREAPRVADGRRSRAGVRPGGRARAVASAGCGCRC